MKKPKTIMSEKLARKLNEAGLPFWQCSGRRLSNKKDSFEPYPTLDDLLIKILPSKNITLKGGKKEWFIFYRDIGPLISNKSLIEAGGEMALWLLQNNYLRFDKRGRRVGCK